MKIRLALLLTLCSPVGAVLAQSPAAPSRSARTVDPVGTYDVSFVRQGEAGTGVLTSSGEIGGSLKGTLEAHGHTMPLPTVTVAGRSVTLRDTADLSITLTFPDDGTVTGKWSGHGDSGELTAVKRQH